MFESSKEEYNKLEVKFETVAKRVKLTQKEQIEFIELMGIGKRQESPIKV
jgi:hypothetical protein